MPSTIDERVSQLMPLRLCIAHGCSINEENQAMASTGKWLSFMPCLVLALCLYVTTMPAQVSAECPTLPTPFSTPGDTQFNNTIRSQMWIIDGVWWGAFSDLSGDLGTGIYFYKVDVDKRTFVKGDFIDDNFLAGKPDTLWNGKELFILIFQSGSLARLYKYKYAPGTETYSLHKGFPIDLALSGGASDIAFDQDSTGKLWAVYTDMLSANVRAIWSTSSDHKQWDTTGKILGSPLANDTEEASTIVRFGGDMIGVVWSNQLLGKIRFRFHRDGDPEQDWDPSTTFDCCEGMPGVADNHLSLRALPDGRLFLIAKDGIGEEGHLHLYVRNVNGTWEEKIPVDPDPTAAPTRPTLVLDLENEEAYVIYRDSSKGGRLFFVRTPLDDPAFTEPCIFIDSDVNSPTSTKQDVDGTTGIVAVASGGDQLVANTIDLAPSSKVMSQEPQTTKSAAVEEAAVENSGASGGVRSFVANDAAALPDVLRAIRQEGGGLVVFGPEFKGVDFAAHGVAKTFRVSKDVARLTKVQLRRLVNFVNDPDNRPVSFLAMDQIGAATLIGLLRENGAVP
jgi:hypothetical protein